VTSEAPFSFGGGGIITKCDYVSKLLVTSLTYCSSMVVKQRMLGRILIVTC